jgi:hypothetical protein
MLPVLCSSIQGALSTLFRQFAWLMNVGTVYSRLALDKLLACTANSC